MNNCVMFRPETVLLFSAVLLVLVEVPGLAAGPVSSVRLVLPDNPGAITRRAGDILGRQITTRCQATVVTAGEAEFAIELTVEESPGSEGYRIVDGSGTGVRIVGNDERGLLYGAGKFLRGSRYDEGGFTPSTRSPAMV